ncbi:hypothetical protein AB0I51_47950 [Streptomyces sp. NPDC050549]|uniref:hypothetical protein n=1 Tax=Streptomyces sp. NPDC050549 TaxID=3155406 RepID=UPI0034174DE4
MKNVSDHAPPDQRAPSASSGGAGIKQTSPASSRNRAPDQRRSTHGQEVQLCDRFPFPFRLGPSFQTAICASLRSPACRAGTCTLLWDTAGQQQLGTDLPTAGDDIDTLAFTDDGATLYAGGPDVLLQGYPVAPDDIVRVLCARAGGGLTGAQWRTYVPDVSYRQVCPATH